MDNPQSIMWVIEALGYGFMGLSTLFASWSFRRSKLEQAVRWLFMVNGVLGSGAILFCKDGHAPLLKRAPFSVGSNYRVQPTGFASLRSARQRLTRSVGWRSSIGLVVR
jgi:hypothetical protein